MENSYFPNFNLFTLNDTVILDALELPDSISSWFFPLLTEDITVSAVSHQTAI